MSEGGFSFGASIFNDADDDGAVTEASMANSAAATFASSHAPFAAASSATEDGVDSPGCSPSSTLKQLQTQKALMEINFEQRCHDFEMQNRDLRKEMEEWKSKAEHYRKELQDSESAMDTLRSEYRSVKLSNETFQSELSQSRVTISSVDAAKRTALENLLKKEAEVDQLNEKCRELTDNLNRLKSEQTKSESSVFDLQSQERNLKFQVTKLEQELALANQQNEWLNREIKQKTEEFANYRTEKSNQVFRLQTELESATGDLRAAEAASNQLRERLADFTAQLDQANNKLQDAQSACILTEEGLRQELTTQKKLAEALRKSDSDKSTKLEQLKAKFDELQDRISTKTAEVDRLLEEKDSEIINVRNELEEKETEISRLRSRVNIADELLASHGLSASPSSGKKGKATPATPTASGLTAISKTGKTFTEIYSDYVEAQAEISRLQSENEQIRQGMNDMLQEVQARASHFGQLETAYEAIVKEANDLSTQLEQVLQDRQQLSAQLIELKKEAKHLQDDNRWARQLNKDLSVQLQSALLEVEEIRGNVPPGASIGELESNVDVEELGAQSVISERLVAFRNIQDLVNKNQELLVLTRKLSDQSENNELEKRDSELVALKQKYTESMDQLRQLAEERRKNEIMVQSLINERDMYRRVAQEPNRRTPLPAQSSPFPDMSIFEQSAAAARSPSPNITPMPQQFEAYQKTITDLHNSFDAYRTETSQDQKVLQEQLNMSQKEAADLRVKSAQLSTQVQFLQERINVLTDTNDQQSKELNELRSRQSSLLANVAQFESRMKDTEQEKIAIRDDLNRARLSLSHLQAEKDLLKTSEVRYQEEQKMLLQERERLNQLIHHLQTIHGDLEKSEVDARRHLENEKSNLQTELSKLRDQITESSSEIKSLTVRKDGEIKEWQLKYEKQLAEVQKVREQLTPLEAKLAGTDERVKVLQDTLKQKEEEIRQIRVRGALVQRLAAGSSRKGDESEKSIIVETDIDAAEKELHARERHLETEMQQLRQELEEIRSDAERQRKHAETYMEIAKSAEEKLICNNEAYDLYKSTTDNRLQELEVDNENLKMQVDVLTANLENSVKESERNIESLTTIKRTLEMQVEQLSQSNKQLSIDAAEAIRNQEVLRQDMQRQRRIAQEATSNYEAELVKHGRNIEQITELRSQMSIVQNQNSSLKLELDSAKDELVNARNSWEEQKSILTRQDGELEARIKELKNQNDILHSQIETMAGQLSKLHKVPDLGLMDADGSVSEEDAGASAERKTIGELREVVRYLRREKEILEFDHEAQTQETRRLQQQLDFVGRSLEETRLQLNEERHRTGHGKFVSENEYAEWKEKSNQLEMIRESNSTLRDENNRNKSRAAKLETQVKQLLSELDPLKEQVLSLQAELEARNTEIKNLEEDNARWKNRIQQILAKYDKIDPEEHKLLCQQYEEAKSNLEQALMKLAEAERSSGYANKSAEQWKVKSEQFEFALKLANEKLLASKAQEGLAEQMSAAESEAAELRGRLEELEAQNKTLAERYEKVNTHGIKWRNRATVAEAALKEMKEKEAGDEAIGAAIDEKIKALEVQHQEKLAELEEKRKKDVEDGRQEVMMRQKLKDAMAEKKIKNLETQNQQLQSQVDTLSGQIKKLEHKSPLETSVTDASIMDKVLWAAEPTPVADLVKATAKRPREESVKRSVESPIPQEVAPAPPSSFSAPAATVQSLSASPAQKKAKTVSISAPAELEVSPAMEADKEAPAVASESYEVVDNYEVEEAPEEETPAVQSEEDTMEAQVVDGEQEMSDFIAEEVLFDTEVVGDSSEEEQTEAPIVEEPGEQQEDQETSGLVTPVIAADEQMEEVIEAEEDEEAEEEEIVHEESEDSQIIVESDNEEDADYIPDSDQSGEESLEESLEMDEEEDLGVLPEEETIVQKPVVVSAVPEKPLQSTLSPNAAPKAPADKSVIVTSSGAVIPKITFEPVKTPGLKKAPSAAQTAEKPASSAVSAVVATPPAVHTPTVSKAARQKAARIAAAATATARGGLQTRGALMGARGALRGAAVALHSIGAGRGATGRTRAGGRGGKTGRGAGANQSV